MGTVTAYVDFTDESVYPAGKTAEIWLQLPQSDENQIITDYKYSESGSEAVKIELTDEHVGTDSSYNKNFHIKWDENTDPADRKAVLSYHVYKRQIVRDENFASKEKGVIDPKRFEEELKETTWSGSYEDGGIVKTTADMIIEKAGAETVYDKAYAIYDWILENVERDGKIPARERGDVVAVLEGTKDPATPGRMVAGSCMEVHSVFVSLCRAEGIPAREAFGMRLVNPNNQPPSQNCRAQFYMPGYGWVTLDPAYALKMKNDHIARNTLTPEIWDEIKDEYWVNANSNWIMCSTGRDIKLDPPQSYLAEQPFEILNTDGTLNLFMFPYAEFDGKYVPGMGSSEGTYKYSYSFEKEEPDCGC
jgi:transglutaminase-like putative cysteine protease